MADQPLRRKSWASQTTQHEQVLCPSENSSGRHQSAAFCPRGSGEMDGVSSQDGAVSHSMKAAMGSSLRSTSCGTSPSLGPTAPYGKAASRPRRQHMLIYNGNVAYARTSNLGAVLRACGGHTPPVRHWGPRQLHRGHCREEISPAPPGCLQRRPGIVRLAV